MRSKPLARMTHVQPQLLTSCAHPHRGLLRTDSIKLRDVPVVIPPFLISPVMDSPVL